MSTTLEDMNNTYTGYCYIIKFNHGLCKIGMTQDPQKRIKVLSSNGLKIKDSYVTKRCKNYKKIELSMHLLYEKNRCNGEYFKVSFEAAVKDIQKIKLEQYSEQELEDLKRNYESRIESIKNVVGKITAHASGCKSDKSNQRIKFDNETLVIVGDSLIPILCEAIEDKVFIPASNALIEGRNREMVLDLMRSDLKRLLSYYISNFVDMIPDEVDVTITKEYLDKLS